MNVVSEKENEISAKRIKLQHDFTKYTAENGFNYQEWLNPPAGHFFESYKQEIDKINEIIAPALTY